MKGKHLNKISKFESMWFLPAPNPCGPGGPGGPVGPMLPVSPAWPVAPKPPKQKILSTHWVRSSNIDRSEVDNIIFLVIVVFQIKFKRKYVKWR